MKEINGTVTLAYVEEDNKQRVIFRVFPLCTKEGSAFHGGEEDFPDEGSLRVVPDKREQSTFKDRMREIGGLCVIHLISGEGKELVKVRQNRNYAPDQGEKNKLAIYSDVICEFMDGGCFEVLDMGADASAALTENVLLHKNKVLYGPTPRETAGTATEESLRPFGNDRFLLHTIDTPVLGKRRIYWDPEAILNWRQRKNALRRKDRGDKAEEGEAEEGAPVRETLKEEAAPVKEAPKEAPVKEAPVPAKALPKEEAKEAAPAPQKEEAEPQRAVVAPPKPAEAEPVNALPIGEKLDILDQKLSFDEQISRLDQTLSTGANRLTKEQEPVEEEPEEAPARFTGTPLKQIAKPITRGASKPESVHHVVERQLLKRTEEGGGGSPYQMVENPIDSLRACLDYVWQDPDMRAQAIGALCDNETFMRDMLQVFRRRGLNTQATAAAQEQLAEIEAERLSLLMQLDEAKQNEKKFRLEAVAALSQKARGESERLKQEVAELVKTKKALTEALQTMSQSTAGQMMDFMSRNIQCLSGAGENRILLSPVIGEHYTAQEMAERIRVHMSESGYGVNEDDAMNLLIYFSVNDAICLCAKTEADAARFAQVLLESLGLQSVSARILPDSYVELVSLLPEDGKRTPTVTVQSMGTESMNIYGHKTLYLDGEQAMDASFCPRVRVPVTLKRSFDRRESWEAVKPASLDSFAELRADVHPMQEEAEKWFDALKRNMAAATLVVPEATLIDMRRFIEVASRKIRGGFLSAADSAVSHWVVPSVRVQRMDVQKWTDILAGLPKALEMLNK